MYLLEEENTKQKKQHIRKHKNKIRCESVIFQSASIR